jgi:hypothetical protein
MHYNYDAKVFDTKSKNKNRCFTRRLGSGGDDENVFQARHSWFYSATLLCDAAQKWRGLATLFRE